MEEIWRDIEGYEGIYQVSNIGRVRSLNYNKTGKVKLMKPYVEKSGYRGVTLKGKRYRVHRLVAKAFVEGYFEGAVVDHIIPVSNGGTDEATNLRWVTPLENNNNELTKQKFCSEENKERLDNIRHLTKEWHGSEEGHEWHKQHYEDMKDKLYEKHDMICEFCGEHFKGQKNRSRFCSNKCKSAWRRQEGLDNEERTCECCGAKFIINKYSKGRTCSRSCANRIRRR